jgi:hypothetical protein
VNKAEAKKIIAKELEQYRIKPYSELVEMIDKESINYELTSEGGDRYQIEIEAFWDNKPNGDVRIIGGIDDGGWRAFIPVSDSFIKNPDGNFVGE